MWIRFLLVVLLSLPVLGAQGLPPGVTVAPGGPAPGSAAHPWQPPVRPLGYVESSAGLDNPKWDGGGTELEMGDVNGDGLIDIVSVGDHGSPFVNTQEHGVMVYYGNGQGSWAVYQNGDFGYGGVALGDVNNDGFIDIGYGVHHAWSGTDFGDQLLEVALGDGTGRNWTAWDDRLGLDGQTWGMFGTDFADLDCDGDLDVGSCAFGSGDGVHVYLNNMDGTWTRTFGILGGNSNFDFIFGDVNNDGCPDFAAEHQDGTVYLGDGAGGFTLADGNLPAPGGWGARDGVDLGDVDGDGCDDISFCTSAGAVEVWLWRPGGTWVRAAAGLPSSGPAEASQLCDMDGDGRLDIVLFGEGLVGVYRGDGAGSWFPATWFTTGSPGYCSALETGDDADRNGRADIVLVSEEGTLFNRRNKLRFYRETSVPLRLEATLVRPAGPRLLKRGSVRFVEWRSAVPGGVPAAVTLKLSTTGPGGPWQTIAAGLPDNGRFQWLLPASLPQSTDCRIRVTVNTVGGAASATSARSFTID